MNFNKIKIIPYILFIIINSFIAKLSFAQANLDSIKTEEKFDLFYKLYFTEINKLDSNINIFGLDEGHYWQISGGPIQYQKNILKKITKRVNIKNPIIKDSTSINIADKIKMEKYLYEQYFNGLRLFSVEKEGGEYKFIVYEEGEKK